MKTTITFTVYGNDDSETAYELPAKWAICPCCHGHGTDRGASVECDGGGFTSSEWAEQDEDFREDYLAGRYDRPCQGCRGHAGRVLEIDRERADPEMVALYDREQAEEADYQALCRAERRMGC